MIGKKIKTAAALMLCATAISACGSSTVHGTDGMLAYMCEKHGDGLEYSGSVSNSAETVAWFSFDELNPTCSYMIFKNKGNDEYEPSYDPQITMSADACYCLWYNGAAVHIEDACVTKVMVISNKTETIEVSEHPFNVYVGLDGGLNGIYCFDRDGNTVYML